LICPPRPGGDHPGRALVVIDLPRVAAILDRIAADIDELARARRADDLAAAAVLPARGRAGPGFSGVLPPSEGPGILGTILGRLRGRAVPPGEQQSLGS
jgi:hypothetical protein